MPKIKRLIKVPVSAKIAFIVGLVNAAVVALQYGLSGRGFIVVVLIILVTFAICATLILIRNRQSILNK